MLYHLESLWGATLIPIRGCAVRWTETEQNSEGGYNSGPILSPLWTKVHEILGHRRIPFVLSSCSSVLVPLCMSRFVQKIFAIKMSTSSKYRTNVNVSWPPFSWGTTPTFLRHGVSAIYHPPFGKVWLSSVCWSPSAKPGNEVENKIYIEWVKMAVQFEAVCGPKFMIFWDDAGDAL